MPLEGCTIIPVGKKPEPFLKKWRLWVDTPGRLLISRPLEQ